MAIVQTDVTIKGITALLMHRFPLESIEAIDKKSMQEQAEIAAYRTVDGELYIPGIAIQRALVAGATFSKGKGRASLQKVVAACVLVNPEHVLLNEDKYEIDARAVVVPATKGRIVRYRPRLDEWEASFTVDWDDELLKEEQLKRVVDDTGSRVGLLDFRPACKGPFGRPPFWNDMAWLKDFFFNDDEVVIQIHPEKKHYVDFHSGCLHLWKPHKETIPLPPQMVWFLTDGELTPDGKLVEPPFITSDDISQMSRQYMERLHQERYHRQERARAAFEAGRTLGQRLNALDLMSLTPAARDRARERIITEALAALPTAEDDI